MKHCSRCNRYLANNAAVCDFCGEPQETGFAALKHHYQRCPRCASFLYDPEHGCDGCGYTEKGHSKLWIALVIIAIAAIVAVVTISIFR